MMRFNSRVAAHTERKLKAMSSLGGSVMGHDPFEDLEIPAPLEESLQRHREHLARLVVSLRSAGVSEQQIEESVTVIVASYKEELLRAMKGMMR